MISICKMCGVKYDKKSYYKGFRCETCRVRLQKRLCSKCNICHKEKTEDYNATCISCASEHYANRITTRKQMPLYHKDNNNLHEPYDFIYKLKVKQASFSYDMTDICWIIEYWLGLDLNKRQDLYDLYRGGEQLQQMWNDLVEWFKAMDPQIIEMEKCYLDLWKEATNLKTERLNNNIYNKNKPKKVKNLSQSEKAIYARDYYHKNKLKIQARRKWKEEN